ncbi:TPA: aminodeoxychorismate/anthranilate synthase component II, partial [Candidatus Peribacteria bacterium]|nr:aminodeoxychorismate/anthranilate synthase component II [Candidatus Peribacteria bacterium]
NYDSFTYNIREQLAKVGVDAVVCRNDKISLDEVRDINPSHIIISPGPGNPGNPEDMGNSMEII